MLSLCLGEGSRITSGRDEGGGGGGFMFFTSYLFTWKKYVYVKAAQSCVEEFGWKGDDYQPQNT